MAADRPKSNQSRRRGAAPRSADDEPFADQERLRYGLHGVGLLTDRDGQGGQAHRATAEATAERLEHGPIEPV